jgi:hypothetical protein
VLKALTYRLVAARGEVYETKLVGLYECSNVQYFATITLIALFLHPYYEYATSLIALRLYLNIIAAFMRISIIKRNDYL